MPKALAISILLSLGMISNGSLAAGAPGIEVTSVPQYGQDGSLLGSVTGVDSATHRVAAYIQIEGLGWWTKPSSDVRTVPIAGDGTFAVDVVTGGLDDRATILCAALVPDGVVPPLALNAARIPAGLAPLALDCERRHARLVEFAGLTWAVKEAPAGVGPGLNRFSDRPEDVFVDAQGRLHLAVRFHDGHWWATEVYLLESLGHGTYAFQTDSRLDELDPGVTFGAFLWDPYGDDESVPGGPHREIDFEDSRWGDADDPTNAQMVVQPFAVPGNVHRYTIPDLGSDPRLTRFFTWLPDRVEFVALRGLHPPLGFPPADVIAQHTYEHDPAGGHFVPTAGRETFRLNLWPNAVELGGPGPPGPADGEPVEVVVTHFVPEPGGPALLLAGLAAVAALASGRRA